MVLVRAMKEGDWGGTHYRPGDVLEIPDGHPRLEAMYRNKHFQYCNQSPPPEPINSQPASRRPAKEAN